jgi:4-aminobutyrate aminotransferase/(S)-3-amino-2-methylpropionate transaminase/5-aminovalerate/4-aminobutyrate aminotransferase
MDTVVEQLLQRREGAVARGINQMHPVYIQRAENAVMYDVNNRRYIDFSGGIAALNTGHLHPNVIAAVERQLHQFTHSCFAATPYESYIAVCERINALMPGDFDRRSFLLTTGSEAVESALKVARVATRRSGVIVFSGAYHGRTFMTLAMNGKIAPYSQGMGIMPGPVFRAPFPQGETERDIAQALAGLKTILTSDIAPRMWPPSSSSPFRERAGFTSCRLRLCVLCVNSVTGKASC